ncbi:MAG: hypothetical protein Q8M39_03160 [Sulfuricurvum sp.]|nr:hypothetical protein [Sulfuricurvum sp.]
MSKKTKSPMTDLSQSGLTAEQIKLLRENYAEEEIAQMKRKAEELELEEIEAIIHERMVANAQPAIPFEFEKYQKKRIKHNNNNNDDEKKEADEGVQ